MRDRRSDGLQFNSLSLSHASPISWSQNELEVCKEQMQTYFKALANKMFAEQSKTEEKVKIPKTSKVSINNVKRQISGKLMCPKCPYSSSTEQGWVCIW